MALPNMLQAGFAPAQTNRLPTIERLGGQPLPTGVTPLTANRIGQPDFTMNRETGQLLGGTPQPTTGQVFAPQPGQIPASATTEQRRQAFLAQNGTQQQLQPAQAGQPLNQAQFHQYYRIPNRFLRDHSFLQRYILIYGRRADATKDENFARKRAHLQDQDERFMTYDRLQPNSHLSDLLTVRIDGDGYRAISIPPTLTLGPMNAEDWSIIRDKKLAVMNTSYISDERKDFLIQRWPYWDEWAKSGRRGIIRAGDRE